MRAFTLIEVMISIALIAILLTGELRVYHSLSRLRRNSEYASAGGQARDLLAQLRKLPFDKLPPQLLKADRQGWVQLGQTHVDADSIRVHRLSGPPEGVSLRQSRPQEGRLQVDPKLCGQSFWIEYDFWGLQRNEVHRVPRDGLLHLERGPVIGVDRVSLAQGDRLLPTQEFTLESGQIRLGEAARGRVAVVDYRGQNSSCRIRGQFVDEQLRPQQAPSSIKLLEVRSRYQGHEEFCVSLLRMAER